MWFVAFFSQFMNDNQGYLYNCILIITAGVVDTFWYIFLTTIATSSIFHLFFTKNSVRIKKGIVLIYILISIILIIDFYDFRNTRNMKYFHYSIKKTTTPSRGKSICI